MTEVHKEKPIVASLPKQWKLIDRLRTSIHQDLSQPVELLTMKNEILKVKSILSTWWINVSARKLVKFCLREEIVSEVLAKQLVSSASKYVKPKFKERRSEVKKVWLKEKIKQKIMYREDDRRTHPTQERKQRIESLLIEAWAPSSLTVKDIATFAWSQKIDYFQFTQDVIQAKKTSDLRKERGEADQNKQKEAQVVDLAERIKKKQDEITKRAEQILDAEAKARAA